MRRANARARFSELPRLMFLSATAWRAVAWVALRLVILVWRSVLSVVMGVVSAATRPKVAAWARTLVLNWSCQIRRSLSFLGMKSVFAIILRGFKGFRANFPVFRGFFGVFARQRNAPLAPTDGLLGPTEAPWTPTKGSFRPTEASGRPTDGPCIPTGASGRPTDDSFRPTEHLTTPTNRSSRLPERPLVRWNDSAVRSKPA